MAICRHGFSVEKIDTDFEVTLEHLQKYIAIVCSVVRDADPKSHVKLWDRLMKESVGHKPSSVFKFIPCKIPIGTVEDVIEIASNATGLYGVGVVYQSFGFYADSHYYTSARELLNWGWSMEKILPTVDFTNYVAFKGMAMYKVYQQLRTHSIPAWISHSQRYTESNHGYWYPDEYKLKLAETSSLVPDSLVQSMWDSKVKTSTPLELEDYMKHTLKIPRREIYALGSDMLQKRIFSGGGYTNNPNDIPHLLAQRTDSHTQKETRLFTKILADEVGMPLQLEKEVNEN